MRAAWPSDAALHSMLATDGLDTFTISTDLGIPEAYVHNAILRHRGGVLVVPPKTPSRAAQLQWQRVKAANAAIRRENLLTKP